MGNFGVFFSGFAAAVVLFAVIGKIIQLRRPRSVRTILQKHFNRLSERELEIHSREFPYRAAPDAYVAVTDWLRGSCHNVTAIGVPVATTFMSRVGIAAILSPSSECLYPTALEYESFDVGEDEPRQSAKHVLWLFEHQQQKLALLWTSETSHSGCGFQTKLLFDVAHAKDGPGGAAANEFFRHLERRIQQAASYRGKILSLEMSTDYRGHSGGIVVHRLRRILRDNVILPESTVSLLERNIVRFVQQRPELAKLGMPTKKGLLLYGPPGTGKTHTIHYLIGAMPGHTTFLVTAEQVGMLDEYVTLARLLQPSIVVLEDVDLIGRDREHIAPGTESLLNRLLNEMDGLRADAEILFLLTTNRPESLEKALAARARPG
jgi:hypothetical protein